jgi:hypothetical protein
MIFGRRAEDQRRELVNAKVYTCQVASTACQPLLRFPLDCTTPSTHLTTGVFAEAVVSVVGNVQPWSTGDFTHVKTLQEAPKNFGKVELMYRLVEGTGRADAFLQQDVAVKQMPKTWIGSGPEDFAERNPDAIEQPWVDLGILQWLNGLQFPFVCELHGVFQDFDNMYVVSSFAQKGDLYNWTFETPGLGREREALVRPLIAQAVFAVRWLHELGIGHRDK